MKTEYQAPKITVISVEAVDVIAYSNEVEWDIIKPQGGF